MPTPAEKKAMLFLATVGFLGVSVRALRAVGAVANVPTSSVQALNRQLEAVDSARAAGKARAGGRRKATGRQPRSAQDSTSSGAPASRQRRTSGRAARQRGSPQGNAPGNSTPAVSPPAAQPAGPLDLDVASADQIESLPGIGPVLAKRVVSDRDARGPFGAIANLQRVSGIGPALASKLAPVVTFSGTPRPLSAAPPDSSARRRAARPRRRPGT